MNKLFTLITIALLIVIAYAFYTAVDTFAASDNTVSICDTVDSNSNAAYDGHSVDSMDANTRHCVADGKPVEKTVKHNTVSNTIEQSVPVVVINDVPVQPVVVTSTTNDTTVTSDTTSDDTQPVVHDDKPKCNNGNGNGAEGCNASDKGNQDETPVKGDKAENHPSK